MKNWRERKKINKAYWQGPSYRPIRLILIGLIFTFFNSSILAQQTISKNTLKQFLAACEEKHSASVAIAYKNKTLLNKTFAPEDSLVAAHSVLKSISALAIGCLIRDQKIKSLNQPVYDFYPEWKQGLKQTITIEHLMNHTSGIACEDPNDDYFNAEDVVQHALCTNIADTPGSRFVYNSKAFLLLLGIIGKAGGQKTSIYLEQTILKPLGITKFNWQFDAVGNVTGFATNALELIKIGQLVLNKGIWNGKELVPKNWISKMLTPSQEFSKDCGLLWWLIPETTHYILDDYVLNNFKKAGVKDSIIDKFRLLKGDYINVNIPPEKLATVFGEDWQDVLNKELYPFIGNRTRRVHSDKIIGYKAEGYLGQYIVIYPGQGIVGARMVGASPSYQANRDEFMDFQKFVYDLFFEK